MTSMNSRPGGQTKAPQGPILDVKFTHTGNHQVKLQVKFQPFLHYQPQTQSRDNNHDCLKFFTPYPFLSHNFRTCTLNQSNAPLSYVTWNPQQQNFRKTLVIHQLHSLV